jgi:hypothetical protein
VRSRIIAPAAGALDVTNTYGVLVGVLRWQDKTLTTYPTEHRKDQELYDTLRKRGVPADHLALLLDDHATRANMRRSLEAIARQAKPGSTFIFYYAGHGWTTAKGNTQFANYDYHSGQNETAFSTSEINEILERSFRGSRVFLFADCCYSGGLGRVAGELARNGFQAAALTSADRLCGSTNNWTFTQTLVDALAGDPLLDDNGDGTITLAELAQEVRLAMLFRERQKCGYAIAGLGPDFRLAAVDRAGRLLGSLAGPFALKEYVRVRVGDRVRTGRIVGFQRNHYAVELYNYSDKQVVLLPASAMSKIHYKTYPVGTTLQIAMPGFPKVKILEVVGPFHRVRIPDGKDGDDEWVLAERLVDDVRTAVEVLWHGEWYSARVLRTEGERYYIHYLGEDDSWDEWVGKERIRFPGRVRNPFGLPDVPDPDGKDVKEFATTVKLPADDRDRNAEQWAPKATDGRPGVLDGEWFGRWDGGSGPAQVRTVRDRVYILHTDRKGDAIVSRWLVEAVRDGKDRLIGRWMTVNQPQETGPFVGRIVSDERIDGVWGPDARWDFRRKLKKDGPGAHTK